MAVRVDVGHAGVGDGGFLPPVGLTPYWTDFIAAGDLNGDDKPDFVTTKEIDDVVVLWLGAGDGTFVEAGSYPVGAGSRHVMVEDLNEDGCLDVDGDKTSLGWQKVCGAQSYPVYRGPLDDLTDPDGDGLPDPGYGECLIDLDGDPSDLPFLDTAVPAPGAGWSYVVGFVDLEGERGLGTTSGNQERFVPTPCRDGWSGNAGNPIVPPGSSMRPRPGSAGRCP